MKPSCPKFHTCVSMETHGGFFYLNALLAADLKKAHVVSHYFFVAKAAPPVSANALKVIHAEHVPARVMFLGALRNELISDCGLMIGNIPLHLKHDFTIKLSAVGVRLEVLKHEED